LNSEKRIESKDKLHWVEEKAQILASNQLRGDEYKSSELSCLEKGFFQQPVS